MTPPAAAPDVLRPTVVEISLARPAENFRAIQSAVAPAAVMPIVKANAIQGPIHKDLGIPGHCPPGNVTTMESLDSCIKDWEDQLAQIGEDATVANTELQRNVQLQQQYATMWSNMIKSAFDRAMVPARNIGG